jgi:hypothetical protein
VTRTYAWVVIVFIGTLSVYAMILQILIWLPGNEIAQPVAVTWTGAWLVGLAFAVWNSYSSALDFWATRGNARSRRNQIGGRWLFRSEVMKAAACGCMTVSGFLTIMQAGTIVLRVTLIMVGGFAIIANEILNRLDRAEIESLPERR